jgi:hypothetical protein
MERPENMYVIQLLKERDFPGATSRKVGLDSENRILTEIPPCESRLRFHQGNPIVKTESLDDTKSRFQRGGATIKLICVGFREQALPDAARRASIWNLNIENA